jgi:SAM-dependent methyltransferase
MWGGLDQRTCWRPAPALTYESMRLLERWLEEFSPSQRILDLGCGSGSLPAQLAGLKVAGVDVDGKALAGNANPSACAESHRLPFAARSFDLVICNHSLEHFHDAPGTIREIRRVLKPGGRLFVTVPDGGSFSDRLYRLLLCGGGHLQRFRFESIVGEIESGAGLHLAGWKELFSSFSYVDKRTFVPAPRGRLPGPLPRRMRWAGHLPAWFFSGTRIFLNLATRLADRCFSTRLSRYGWALAFSSEDTPPRQEPGSLNVCMFCGAGFDTPPERMAWLLYRCPYCRGANYLFRQSARRLTP